MSRTVSASEAKRHLGKLMRWVEENNDAVVIERRRVPVVVLLSYAQYQEFVRLRAEVQGEPPE